LFAVSGEAVELCRRLCFVARQCDNRDNCDNCDNDQRAPHAEVHDEHADVQGFAAGPPRQWQGGLVALPLNVTQLNAFGL